MTSRLFAFRRFSHFAACLASCIGCALVSVKTCVAADPALASSFTAAQLEFFQSQVKPILDQHCVKCHGAKPNPKGGLRLTSREAILRGGDSGPAVLLDKPAESLLLQAVNYDGYEMPPSGKLPQPQIDILTQWVRSGLPLPDGAFKISDEPAPEKRAGNPAVNDQSRQFWSFQPIRRPMVPSVEDPSWAANPIDAFVAARLAAGGLKPNGPAAKSAWLRRACYDLTGLPPEPADVAAFLGDSSPQAYEKVIDQLLDSPHYGERWGRHWLDLVRYAETNSYERDGAKPFVWRYRDYVIRSLNADKPYDQFIREQLAGDELQPVTPEGIVATAYYRLGIWDDEPADPELAFYDDMDDIVQTTGQVFLGLTIGCARCHDHKLDPIPHRDYYRFLAFFRNIRRYGVRGHDTVLDASVRTIALDEDRQVHARQVAEHESRVNRVETDLKAIEDLVRADLVGVENDEFKTEAAREELVRKRVPQLLSEQEFRRYQSLVKQRDRLRAEKPDGLAQALCVKENGRSVPSTHVLVRGNPHVKGELVEPGFPEVLTSVPPRIIEPAAEIASSGRRLALAQWLASAENPLTARVMVNRIWQHHFGRGLVRSASDFGFQGTPPTHPELLDWLAAEFVSGGWRLKRMHKLIMLSRTYQMSSQPQAAALAMDPENNLFGRFNMRRLSAEEIRDSILAVNQTLNRDKMFGASVYVPIPAEVLAGQSRPGEGWGRSSPADENRRSIYIHVKRSLHVPILTTFDAADTDNSCPVRFATTQPTQALGLLNSAFTHEQAGKFAAYLKQEAGDDLERQVTLALRRATQRETVENEVVRGVQLIAALRNQHQLTADDALRYFCLTMLNLNEFVYLD